jgi:hypothetical protein
VSQGLSQYIATMNGTKDERDRRRAQRWLTQSGGLSGLSPAAFDLLTRRLAARYRARWQCAPLFVLAGVVLASTFVDGHALGTGGWGRSFAARALTAYAVLSVETLLADALTRWAERGIAQTLPSRVSRGTAVPVAMMLGRRRTAFVLAALGLEAMLAVIVLVMRPGWLEWTYLAAFLAASWLVAVGVRQAAARATIAVDALSLAIDERLRSDEAFQATGPLLLLLAAFPSSLAFDNGTTSLGLVWAAATVIILVLRLRADIDRALSQRSAAGWFPTVPAPGGDLP